MWPVLLAAWIVPHKQRAEWRTLWETRYNDFWILVGRGEIIPDSQDTAILARETVADAISMRVRPAALAEWLQGPAVIMQAALALTVVLALASYGFSGTRHLLGLLMFTDFGSGDPRQNTLIAHGVPMVFAFFTALVLAGIGRRPSGGHGWRYWTFLTTKTFAATALATLAWIESVALAHSTYNNPLSVLPPILLTLFYIAAIGWTVQWSLSDQRARCPVCLNRLAMPVSIGSWASVLEPATTELVCPEGHGSLAMTETESAEADRWTNLDNSWKDLFEHKPVSN
jgi:hypothetical protein